MFRWSPLLQDMNCRITVHEEDYGKEGNAVNAGNASNGKEGNEGGNAVWLP